MKYIDALKRRRKVTTIPAGLTREYVIEAIAGISVQLKGPMSNTERVMLVHDRDDFRDILALMDAPRGGMS